MMTTATAMRVDDMLAVAAADLKASSGPVVLREKAQEIVDSLREEDPDLLCDWFEDHAVTLLAQNLRLRLAEHRRRERKSVFDPPSVEGRQVEMDPFTVKLAVEGNIWKPLGEMTRPDWAFIATDRSENAHANLFDLALARAMVKKLPNDTKLTREVVNADQLARMRTTAEKKAQAAIKSF